MVIINSGKFIDERGALVFSNQFNLSAFQRCYHITHSKASIVRAWQGHKNESKAFWVTKGSFLLQWIAITNFHDPNMNLKVENSIISFEEPKVVILPGGFANGFQALEKDSSIMIFSDASIEDSREDDYRWEKDYFKKAQWR